MTVGSSPTPLMCVGMQKTVCAWAHVFPINTGRIYLMPRNLLPMGYKSLKSSKIIREQPDGPTMTEAEFKAAMVNMPNDAARWRYLRRNWGYVFELLLAKRDAVLGSELEAIVDRLRNV